MKINFNIPVKDYKGQALVSNGKVQMLNDHVGQAMYMVHSVGGNSLTPDEKYMAYKICNKMQSQNEIELNSEECAFIIKVCGESLISGAYGQIRELIEG